LPVAYGIALEALMKDKVTKSYMSAAQRRALNEERDKVPPQIRAAFDSAFAAWKETWFS